MALNGTVGSGTYNNRYSYYIDWSATQNIANNTSTITIKWVMKKTASDPYNAYNKAGSSTVDLNIGGTWSGSSRADFDMRSSAVGATAVLKTYTRTVTHNADGTLSLNVSGSHNTGLSWGTKNASGTITLNTIPRASSLRFVGTLNVGNTITLYTDRASSSFTHTIEYKCGSLTGTVGTGVGDSISWTIPKNFANQFPNSNSVSFSLTCKTYNGSTLVGTTITNWGAIIPETSEFQPTITGCTLIEAVSGLNAKFSGFVQSKSKITVNATASGVYSSTIKNWSIQINGATYTSKNFTTGYLSGSGNQNCIVKVTDTRGRTASKTYSYSVISYTAPTISQLSVNRCDSDGTLNDEGECAKVSLSASIAAINNKNDKSFKLLYKKQSSSSWSTNVLSNSSYTLTSTQIITGIDVNSEYDFKLEVTDYFSTTSKSLPLSTAFVLMDYKANGKGVAFGKVSTKDGVELGMTTYLPSGNELLDYEIVDEW